MSLSATDHGLPSGSLAMGWLQEDHKHHEHVGPSAGWIATRSEEQDGEKERGKTGRKRERWERDGNERASNVIRTYTSGSASARALTSPLSVQARQPAVHPPWATVDSSLGCHDDRSTARAVGASETTSRGRRWRERARRGGIFAFAENSFSQKKKWKHSYKIHHVLRVC